MLSSLCSCFTRATVTCSSQTSTSSSKTLTTHQSTSDAVLDYIADIDSSLSESLSPPDHSIHLYPPRGSYQPLFDVVQRPPSTRTTTGSDSTAVTGSTIDVSRRHRLTSARPRPSTVTTAESTSYPAEKINEEDVARPRQRRTHVSDQPLTTTPCTYHTITGCHDVHSSTTANDGYLQLTCDHDMTPGCIGTRPASMSLVSLQRDCHSDTSATPRYGVTTPRATTFHCHCATPSTSDDVTLRVGDVMSTGSDDDSLAETARQHLDTGTYLKLKRGRQPLDDYTALRAQRNSVISSHSDAIYESIPRRDATAAPCAGHGDDETASTYSRMDYLHPL